MKCTDAEHLWECCLRSCCLIDRCSLTFVSSSVRLHSAAISMSVVPSGCLLSFLKLSSSAAICSSDRFRCSIAFEAMFPFTASLQTKKVQPKRFLNRFGFSCPPASPRVRSSGLDVPTAGRGGVSARRRERVFMGGCARVEALQLSNTQRHVTRPSPPAEPEQTDAPWTPQRLKEDFGNIIEQSASVSRYKAFFIFLLWDILTKQPHCWITCQNVKE